KVEQLDEVAPVIASAQKDVGGLEVAVGDATLVQSRQSRSNLSAQLDDIVAVESACLLQSLREILSLQIVHHHVRRAIGEVVEVDHRGDVRISNRAGDLRFPLEALASIRQR